MKKKLIFGSKMANLAVSWFNFIMFFSMRCCWSGISKTLGYEKNETWILLNLPVLIFFLFFGIFGANIALYLFMKKEKNLWSYIFNGVNGVFYSDPCYDCKTRGEVSIAHALISYQDVPKIFKKSPPFVK